MATDPHPRWARRVRLLRQCSLEEPRLVAADQMAHQALDLIVRIVNTPSCTLGGVREQLALADQLLNEPDQRIGPADLAGRAVRAALQGVDRLLAERRLLTMEYRA